MKTVQAITCWKNRFKPFYLTGSWINTSNKWVYKLDNQLHKSWLKNNGTWYFFNDIFTVEHPLWAMKIGWRYNGGKWYYLTTDKTDKYPEGAMRTGWIQDAGTWYYLNTV
ncbi:hypothetical protein [Bacillus sp. FJAT-50079]|uniref:hypothetical protein n=1 Tax=Bacillus sp. FJAT-50079 TaxID=2833577 RepID=UPI001BCA2FBA|nr:hypothetical protein [Bacillus sp. FJAT-50079]MBS4206744.1 hypothetical protein [Bacillus sp. FJAT-50079]